MVTAAKAAFDYRPNKALLVGECQVQQITSSCWLLYYLGQVVVIYVHQESPGLLCPAVLFLQQISMYLLEVPFKDKGLTANINPQTPNTFWSWENSEMYQRVD